MPATKPPARLPRVVIEGVTPCIDGGRHPVKRSLGDVLQVGADIFKDGHDLIGARVRYRRPGEREWQSAPMIYEYDPDRWYAAIELDRLGRWAFAVEAWPDHYGSWRADLEKRRAAGQDVAGDLIEGAAILRRGAARARTAAIARSLADENRSVAERLAIVDDEDLIELVAGPRSTAELTRSKPDLEVNVDRELARAGAWYELFPRSQASEPQRHGTFADVERRLPELARLGFDVVYLPPIHPIGRTHRKGPNNNPTCGPGDPGSPWAIGGDEGGHTAIHPELGTVADFERLVAGAAELGIEIALDFALQCSPDHPWVREHPEWFHHRADGTIRHAENPPKKYEDIYPLDFWCEDRQGLWNACRDILLYWIERGVKVFRVDNPHTKPFAFWEWCLRDIQERHPDTIFLSEAFTRPKRMVGLAKIGFHQSYTYFTWKNDARELREFLEFLLDPQVSEVYRPNFFANTPDILHEYLQRGGRPAFRVRLLLAATLSPSYGIYSGFELCENVPVRPGSEEYLDSEKYQLRHRDWDAPGHIKDDIAALNRIRRGHPALLRFDNLELLDSDNGEIFWFLKSKGDEHLFVAVNLDPRHTQEGLVSVPLERLGIGETETYRMHDLLDDDSYEWRGRRGWVRLDPAQRPGHLFRLVRTASGGGAP